MGGLSSMLGDTQALYDGAATVITGLSPLVIWGGGLALFGVLARFIAGFVRRGYMSGPASVGAPSSLGPRGGRPGSGSAVPPSRRGSRRSAIGVNALASSRSAVATASNVVPLRVADAGSSAVAPGVVVELPSRGGEVVPFPSHTAEPVRRAA